MGRFVGIGYYDLSSLYTSYIGKHKRGLVESAHPAHRHLRTLDLLNDREETEVLKEWRSAQTFLQKVQQRLKLLPQPAEVMNAYIRAFQPGAFTQWIEDDAIDPDGFMRAHVLLNPVPTFRLYSDEEAFAPSPWVALVVDHKGRTCASNFNAPATAHELVLEMALDIPG